MRPLRNEPDFLLDNIAEPPHAPAARSPQNPWLGPMIPLLLSTTGGVLCYRVAGPTLGLFIGGLLLAAILTGPLVTVEETWLGRSLVAFGVVHGIAGVWFFAALQTDIDLGPWAAAYLSLYALVLALSGLAIFLRSVHFGPTGAAAVATVWGLAWITWPIWLSPSLHGETGDRIVAWLVPANPLFAMNSALRDRLDYWAAQGIAYNLTKLDEIPYTLPTSVGWCVLLHGADRRCVRGGGMVYSAAT